MELDELVRGMRALDDQASRAVTRLESMVAEAWAFGADGPGQLGEVGRSMAAQHEAAMAARRSELTRVVATLTGLTDAVAKTAAGYRDLETRQAARP